MAQKATHIISIVAMVLILCSHVVVSHDQCTTITTFNAALTPHVPQYDSRKAHIPDALVAEGSDVQCIQEYWLEDDMAELLDDVDSAYPYHYSAIHHEVGALRKTLSWWESFTDYPDAACSYTDAGYFLTVLIPCGLANGCADAFSESSKAGITCLAQHCRDELRSEWLSADCIQCAVVTAISLSTAIDSCVAYNPFGDHNRLNSPGLVLLSKKPILNARYESYFPGKDMTLQRGYIEAEIEHVGQVVCTHLSSLQPNHYFEYDLDFGDYFVQQQLEINYTLAIFGDSNHIFLGDMNTGPVIPENNIEGEAPANYDLLLAGGYQSPYIDQDGQCTYCESNPIVSGHNNAIDHVLIMGDQFSSVTAKRVLDQTDPVLSDHYGVQAKVCETVP